MMVMINWKLHVKRWFHFFKTGLGRGWPAAVFNGWPSQELEVYAITGTDGKTTSSTLLYHVLQANGYPVALISTVGAFCDGKSIKTGLHTTSPQPDKLQKLLRQFADEGIEHVVLEVTSHGWWQFRTAGTKIDLAGITNVSAEHLDYFRNWQTVAKVKGSLLSKAKLAFINADDQSAPELRSLLEQAQTPFKEYHQSLPSNKVAAAAIKKRFPEQYNQCNANLVWTFCQQLGMSSEGFAQGVESFSGVPGRMEKIEINQKQPTVIVDFAHTPNALKQALSSLRSQTKGKLIAVYGSAGERDQQKRPQMGKIGTQLADLAVFTAEDPRREQVEVIIRQMKEGVDPENLAKVVSVADRRQAIKFALDQAGPQDTVVILGKGHEESMCFGQEEKPWSDKEVATELLTNR